MNRDLVIESLSNFCRQCLALDVWCWWWLVNTGSPYSQSLRTSLPLSPPLFNESPPPPPEALPPSLTCVASLKCAVEPYFARLQDSNSVQEQFEINKPQRSLEGSDNFDAVARFFL